MIEIFVEESNDPSMNTKNTKEQPQPLMGYNISVEEEIKSAMTSFKYQNGPFPPDIEF